MRRAKRKYRVKMADDFLSLWMVLLCVWPSAVLSAAIDSAPIVLTASGQVQGTVERTLLDQREYFAFRAIPYAKPPIGVLRFKAPVAADTWPDVRDGSAFGPPCAQPNMYMTGFIGTEDCLTLNVYTPDIAHDAGLPVIVHIHSGAYLLGSSRGQGPDILLNENVVLVTINYRLGPFGFLRLEGGEYSGNMGLKDQLLALKWVRNNARVFGGDPTLITVFGHSAGAAAVNMHVWSTASRPYFKRAVMSGAAAFVPWAYKRVNHTQMLTRTVAKQSGKVEEQVKLDEVVEWLQTVDANAIGMLDNRQLFIGGQRSKLIDFTWLPVVEDDNDVEPFFTKSAYEYARQENNIDTLFVFTDAESLLLTGIDLNAPHSLKPFDEYFEVELPLADLQYNTTSAEYKDYARDIRQFYFGNKSIDGGTLREYVQLLSDSFFIYGIHRAVEAQAKVSNGKTFLLKFAVDLKLNFFRKFANATRLDIPGATHTEDMCYIFRLSELDNLIDETEYDRLTKAAPEGQMSKILIKLIANFAEFGNPTPQNVPIDFRAIDDAANMNYLIVKNNGLEMGTQPRRQSIQFWNEFFHKHGSKINLY